MLVALRNGTNLRYIHQDSLGSTSVVTDSSGAQYGYTRYYPYGSTRDSGGSLDTSKKFTGQRLDGTGLYYYGARYYDPVIGRFISPDSVVGDSSDPQNLSRYSYVLNNPLKYTDPNGLDVIIVGGSTSKYEDLADYYTDLVKQGIINAGEKYALLYDTDSEFMGFDVNQRLQRLYDELATGHTDVKLLGFSEGAATVGAFLSQLASDPAGTQARMGSTKATDIAAAVLFECPASTLSSLRGNGFDRSMLNKLPDRLAKAKLNIRLSDVWNKASIVHGGSLSGWGGHSYSYDSRPWYERGLTAAAGVAGQIYRTARYSAYHSNILENRYSLQVLHNTFYP